MTLSFQLVVVAIFVCSLCPIGVSAAAPPTITKVVRGFRTPYQAGMPEQMVVDRFDNVYSLDFENNHLAMFDFNGTFIRSFTTDNPPFKGPTGVAVDSELNVYVADQGNQRLVKLDAQGNLLRVYSSDVFSGAPMGVAVDGEGFIYIFSSRSAIFRMAQNGTILQNYDSISYGTRGGLAIDCDGNLLVADMQRARALRFDSQTGAVLNVWNTTNPALNYPWNIAGDCAGHVYIADGFGGRAVQLDNHNNLLAIYVNGTGYGVAVSSKGDVLVAPGGGYNVAVMAKPEKRVVEAVSA